ncbi:TPA: type II toxin-antitoxin system PemK/MazF family toxin [Morganella morganii]|nr:type II toxin-antitoxin system PemK/MazF family toxin [Morganella morganii]HDF2366529.1 type II toxin-antitoxin system PemK/MazF family toxin [Morganella morganii]
MESLKYNHYSPLPSVGDIVWCRFPEVMGCDKPKSRPVLVLAVSSKLKVVRVAFGTSQKTDRIYSGEFLIKQDSSSAFKQSGLSYSTKFDLTKCANLPFSNEFFDRASTTHDYEPAPKMGSVHISYNSSLQKAKGEASKKDGV